MSSGRERQCKAWSNGSVLAASVSPGEMERYRACSESMYRRGRATLVFVHVHKGGGTTFVSMARANGAGLASGALNGDPVRRVRDEWWKLEPSAQREWFRRMRRAGTRFVSSEKGFPAVERLLAPAGLVYAIVVREPASRFVSYYFWRYRDVSAAVKARAYAAGYLGLGRGVAKLRPGAPTFAEFVEVESPLDGYYVSRLLGREDRAAPIDEADLAASLGVLEQAFSLVLVTENLDNLGPVVEAFLGWRRSRFDAFHQKSNPAPDKWVLERWRPDWREEIQRRMPYDRRFYAAACRISEARLAQATRQLKKGGSST
ncbi:hypothetical protein CTAYLR_008748 [Chrysophaeum taylorii]|uniref:Sulfotransferase family protein n=1 Tax=Chrysophaeum taylorii TaxID=2483200 RepID=A0AAD7XQ47_9STRA|nr:hypothetical protein CTAYLR_008748 [Chrysophaeum taylorii]